MSDIRSFFKPTAKPNVINNRPIGLDTTQTTRHQRRSRVPTTRPSQRLNYRARPFHPNRQSSQSSLTGDRATRRDSDSWGDEMGPKPPNTMRIAFANINRLPVNPQEEKNQHIQTHVKRWNIDILALADICLNWHAIPTYTSWHSRFRKGLPRSAIHFAYNTHEGRTSADPVQFGGTGLILQREASSRLTPEPIHSDPHNLGRFTCARLQGRESTHVTIISAYAPVHKYGKSKKGLGHTVHEQHERYLRDQKRFLESPRQAFTKDLSDYIQRVIDRGDKIILGIDANEDIRQGALHDMLTSHGLTEAITRRHINKTPPATCDKNNQRTPIDGLWISTDMNITAGGYCEYEGFCSSDHRCIWFDIPFMEILGHNPPNLPRPKPNRIDINDPRSMKRYVQKTHKLYRKHDMLNSALQLQSLSEGDSYQFQVEAEYNHLYSLSDRLRRRAEKKTRPLRMGKYAWSPEYQLSRDAIELWRLTIKRFHGRVSGRRIRRFMRKCKNKDAFSIQLSEATQRLRKARATHRHLRTLAVNLRTQHLHSLADALATKNKSNQATEIRNLIHTEKQREQARKIRASLHKHSKGLATKLFTNDEGHRVECDTQELVALASIKENEKRFTNALNAPTMNGQLLTDIGIRADNEGAEQILNGTYAIPENTDPYVTLLLKHLKTPQSVLDSGGIPASISKEDHIRSWSTVKKIRASDCRGLTAGHFIAGTLSDEIASIDAIFRSIPSERGFSPKVWQHASDCSIPKKEDILDAAKMRTIVLYLADYNMNNKFFARALMALSESLHTLHKAQGGSRKFHRAIFIALNKLLTMDILRQQRLPGFICSNDMLQCYDRIVHNIAILSLRRLGLAASTAESMFATLQFATHNILTGFGLSKEEYGGMLRTTLDKLPIMGVGQGNGAGPAIWAAISSVLLSIMDQLGYGATLQGSMSHLLCHLIGYAFVDDTDIIHTARDPDDSIEALLPEFQQVVDAWAGLIKATGGAIEPTKSFIYSIDFRWNGNSWKYKTETETPGSISILSPHTNEREPLERLEPQEARRTLGIMMAMDGNQKLQTSHLREKAEIFASHIRSSRLDKNEAFQALTSVFMKTIEYPMIATSLTRDQWSNVMAPITKHVIPKAGIGAHFPHALLYAPKEVQGLGLNDPYIRSYILQIQAMIQQQHAGSLTAEIQQISFESLRLEIGLPGYITDAPFQLLKLATTKGWFHSMWKFMNQYHVHLIDPLPKLITQRQHDVFLTQLFINLGASATDMKLLNNCRQFLRVTYLSDIATAKGDKIIRAAYKLHNDFQSPHTDNYKWPRRPPSLTATHRNLWQKMIQTLTNDGPFLVLKQPLGEWSRNPLGYWQWRLHRASMTLFQKEKEGWRTWISPTHIASRVVGRLFRPLASEIVDLPPDTEMTYVTQQTVTSVKILSSDIFQFTTDTTVEPQTDTFQTLANKLTPNEKWALDAMQIPNQGTVVASAITGNTCRAICDGSYKLGRATSAFSLHAARINDSITGCNLVPGGRRDACAYRGELGGIAGVLTTAQILCQLHKIQQGSITIGLDGASTFPKILQEHHPDPFTRHYDIIMYIRRKIAELPISIHLKYVAGHQDTKNVRLDWWAEQNIRMDRLAKRHMAQTMDCNNDNILVGLHHWSLRIGNTIPNNCDANDIYSLIYQPIIKDYWCNKKQHFQAELWDKINWKACSLASKNQPFGLQRWLSKNHSGHCATGTSMLRRQLQDHDQCPLCSEHEDIMHVILCKDQRAKDRWEYNMGIIQQWYNSNNTHPDLANCLNMGLRGWHSQNTHPLQIISRTNNVQQAIRKQETIGWYQFLLGRISNDISDIQETHLQSLGLERTGLRWTQALINKLWTCSWDMWEHRNTIKHNTNTPQLRAELDVLATQLTEQKTQGTTGMLRSDHNLILQIDKALELPKNEQILWLQSIKTARLAATAKAASNRSLQRQRSDMKKFLHGQPVP